MAEFGFQISESASFSVVDRFRSAYTGELLEFVEFEDDVVLPLNRQKRNHVRAALGIELSPTLTFTIPISYDTSLFEPDDVLQPRLANGDRFATGVGFSRQLNDKTTASVNYTYARSDQTLMFAESHSVALGLARSIDQFTNFGIGIGAGLRETNQGRRYVLGGGASIGRQFENFSFNLGYRRNLGALFGLGREVINNSLRLSHHRQLSRNLAIQPQRSLRPHPGSARRFVQLRRLLRQRRPQPEPEPVAQPARRLPFRQAVAASRRDRPELPDPSGQPCSSAGTRSSERGG